ncbi:Type-2 restriction enzyme NspV (fragment) [Microcystis aeruginosa PCC 9806]|uniref:Type-2 restriction enzyme NspV n=1 Tax=Microcystis aeruginosa PCC 9806 TaxID=1160282 RepID=I4H038_MICAE
MGYSLIIFVYEKLDDSLNRTASLRIIRTIFVSAERTADFQMTRGIRNILNNQGNKDDLIAFILDKNLPVDEILVHLPGQGFLTISNALQWRLQYTRVIDLAGHEEGLIAIYREN